MKRKIKLLLALAIALSLFGPTLTVKAEIQEDIMKYVVGGTGTFEDPYVFSDNENPYALMFNEHVISTIKEDTTGARHMFTASLTGGTRSNQWNGGKWIYSSGGPSVSINGVFVYTKINYVNENDTENTYVAMTNPTYSSIIKTTLSNVGFTGLSAALSAAGMTLSMTNAVCLFFSVIPVASIVNQATLNALASAVVNNNGSMVVQYKHSYNGSWYSATATVEWDTYPTAYLPGSAYGVGTYTSR